MTDTVLRDAVAALPWVRHLKRAQRCTGRTHGGKRPCKNPAYWRFTSLKTRRAWSMDAPNGVYCWSHLVHWGVYGSMDEEDRTRREFRRSGVLCPSRSDKGTECDLRNHHAGHHRPNQWEQKQVDGSWKLEPVEEWA